ncbi:MAG: hypothetical protein Q9192_000434 [Flavoplaca navasiana]
MELPLFIHSKFRDRPIVWKASRRIWQLVVDLTFIIINALNLSLSVFVVLTAPVGHGPLKCRGKGIEAVIHRFNTLYLQLLAVVQLRQVDQREGLEIIDLDFIIVNSVTMACAFYAVGTSPPGHPALRHRKVALAIEIGVAQREGLEIIDLGFIIVISVTMACAFYVVGTSPPGHPAIRHRKVALAIMIVVALVTWS